MLAMLLAGCGPNWAGGWSADESKLVAPPPHASEAVQAIEGLYDMGFSPTIYWYGRGLTCKDGRGLGTEDNCRFGEESDGYAIVAAPPNTLLGDPLWSDPPESPLAHEMAHAASEQHGEGGDPDHAGHFFAAGGEVEQATAMLQAHGW